MRGLMFPAKTWVFKQRFIIWTCNHANIYPVAPRKFFYDLWRCPKNVDESSIILT